MSKIIGVTDLQRRFRKIFDEVAEDHVPYILTRGSRPEAALIPYEQYQKLVRAEEAGILRKFDDFLARMTAAGNSFSEREVDQDVQAARKAYRSPRHR
jgi:prevent-host-death family protein